MLASVSKLLKVTEDDSERSGLSDDRYTMPTREFYSSVRETDSNHNQFLDENINPDMKRADNTALSASPRIRESKGRVAKNKKANL